MPKRITIILAAVLFLLALLVGGELYWLKRLEKKGNNIEKNKAKCEFDGKTYQQDEFFLIRLSSGCSLCRCAEDGLPVCEKTYCPEEAPDEK